MGSVASGVLDVVAGRLRAAEQRFTPNRQRIVQVLAQAERPLSIPELLSRLPQTPQSSAYRNMAALEQAGVVRRIMSSDEFARYELAEDLTNHHHHLICSECGAIEDFTLPRAFEQTLEKTLARAARMSGFRTQHHRLDLVGLCARCA